LGADKRNFSVKIIIVFGAALLLVGCVGGSQRSSGSYPNGIVKTPEDAIAIAEKECGPSLQDRSGEWRARLDKDVWFAWLTPNAALQISINAVDGKTTGCVVGGAT
jgi:hypothetical protein